MISRAPAHLDPSGLSLISPPSCLQSSQFTPLMLIFLLFRIHSTHTRLMPLPWQSFPPAAPFAQIPTWEAASPTACLGSRVQLLNTTCPGSSNLKSQPSPLLPDQHPWFTPPCCTFSLFQSIYHFLLLCYSVSYYFFYFFSFSCYFSLDCWNVGTDYFLIDSLMYILSAPSNFCHLKGIQ